MISTGVQAAMAAVVGLIVGSFLNVVIHRLPRMLERQWAEEAAGGDDAPAAEGEALSLARPRSRCPSCGHAIRWYENIPVVSFAALLGRCSACDAPISARYPLVEALTAALFAFAIWRWGFTPAGASWCAFSAALVALAGIDWDTTLLPDDITLPLLWAGLLAASLHWSAASLEDAVWGAAAGYLALWTVHQLFRLATGQEGLGYGDFKLLAAIGAWFGWQALLPIVLIASAIGAAAGVAMKVSARLREGRYVPFGPFLAGSALATMIASPAAMLRALGL